jgi:RNA polymerase sigma-70 factor, ECF subfamily
VSTPLPTKFYPLPAPAGFVFRKMSFMNRVTYCVQVHNIHRDNAMTSFKDLYQQYSMDVYRFAYWLAGNAADAEDITSETFIRVWVNLQPIRTETLKAYLFTIARNFYLQQVRKDKRQADLDDTIRDPQPGLESIAEQHAELQLAQRILLTLPETDRMAFVLRVEHDVSYAEIARILALSEVAVKVKVHRIRKKLLAARLEKEVVP